MSWCDLDLTFDLPVVTFTFKILCGLYLSNRKAEEVDTWLRGVGMQCHGVTLI